MRSRSKLLRNLNTLYQQAINRDSLNTALKIIELKAKIEGCLPSSRAKNLSIKDLSDAEIDAMIEELMAS